MTDFTKQYSGFRYALTRRGDTLQQIAYRELGDANDWAKLVWFNDLIAPFITDDPAEAGDRVLLTGGQIKIPTTVAESNGEAEADDVLQADCRLTNRRLSADSTTGDFLVVSGRENLKQAISHRLITDPGELIYHPTYGCKISRRRGAKNNAVALLLGRMDVQDALVMEPRLKRINKITTTSNGDALSASADVTPISGGSVTAEVNV